MTSNTRTKLGFGFVHISNPVIGLIHQIDSLATQNTPTRKGKPSSLSVGKEFDDALSKQMFRNRSKLENII